MILDTLYVLSISYFRKFMLYFTQIIYKAGVSEDRIAVLITPAKTKEGHTDDRKEKILWDAE